MRKSKKRRSLIGITEHPPYIILNERAQVYTGLIGGYPNFSDDLDQAKPLEGQAKFDTLKRFARIHLEQIFL
jgi:hypothetical protein